MISVSNRRSSAESEMRPAITLFVTQRVVVVLYARLPQTGARQFNVNARHVSALNCRRNHPKSRSPKMARRLLLYSATQDTLIRLFRPAVPIPKP